MNEYMHIILSGLLELIIQPFYWAGLLLLLLYYRRQGILERKLFHIRLHAYGVPVARALLGGLVAGIILSLILAGVGFTLTMEGAAAVWIMALLLLIFRIRFANLIYAVGALGLLQLIFGWIPGLPDSGVLGTIVQAVEGLNIAALLILAALAHIAESVLIAKQGKWFALPTYIPGKRGRPIGAYVLRMLWLIPTLLLVPSESGLLTLPWTPPLLSILGFSESMNYTLLALPVMVGMSEATWTLFPERKAIQVAKRGILFGGVLLVLAVVAVFWTPVAAWIGIAGIVLREALIRDSHREEDGQAAIYSDSGRGLKILAVQPHSPADDMKILPGETLLKVNGSVISNRQQMHEALRMNSAFCKLEVQNRNGESKFLQRPIYAGDHHQLGFIFAPDDASVSEKPNKPLSLLGLWSVQTESQRVLDESTEVLEKSEKTEHPDASQQNADSAQTDRV